MDIQLDKQYVDRQGVVWRIIRVNGPRIAPVTGARWESKTYQTRTFQRDGRYWTDKQDNWDLIAEYNGS